MRITRLRHRLLKIPDLTVEASHIGVIGPNGSGKTTLLEVCAGMERPEEGTVRFSDREPVGVRVGFVGEFPDRTILFSRVYDEIASSLRFRHRSCPRIDEKVRQTADTAGISHLLERSVSSLSGGEKILVALAAACADDPEVLILDEVDSHLDEATAEHVYRIAQESTAEHILWCTQAMETAARADYLLFMDNGEVRHHGPPEDVFSRLEKTCFYPPLWRVCQ